MNAATQPWYRRLDWNVGVANTPVYWRVALCVMCAVTIALFINARMYPHFFWFFRLWASIAIGGFIGLIAGFGWQLADPERLRRTSGKFLLGSIAACSLFAIFGLVLTLSQLRGQEHARAEIVACAGTPKNEIRVVGPRGLTRQTQPAALADFDSMLGGAQVYMPSHETPAEELTLTIYFADGHTAVYPAWTSPARPDDLILRVPPTNIVLLGARDWMTR